MQMYERFGYMENRLLAIAPDIFRKRLLIKEYFDIDVTESTLIEFFSFITQNLALKTYGDPIIHATKEAGKERNQGFDGFVPLIDSGIYIAVWSNHKFLSSVLYTCKDFDEHKAVELLDRFFTMPHIISKLF